MMSVSHRNLIFDAIHDLSSAASLPEIGARFAAVTAKLGFNALGINGLPPAAEHADPVILTEITPNTFRDCYIHERFYAVDHLAAYARTTHRPFRFGDAPYAQKDRRRHERFMQALAIYQMGKGAVVPFRWSASIPACVWLAGGNPELHDDAMLSIQLISLFAASKAQALSGTGQGAAPPGFLTKREREVLAWAAQGKSAWETGEILGISKRTVDEHAQVACRKLKAVNRTQAVALALQSKFITL